MRKILPIMGFLLIASYGWTLNFRWTGNGDGSKWKDPDNWTNHLNLGPLYPGSPNSPGYPNSNDHVHIDTSPASSVYIKGFPVVTGTETIKSLTIKGGGHLEIASGAILRVTGNDDVPRINIPNAGVSWSYSEPFETGDNIHRNAVYYKGGTIRLDGTLDIPNGSILQTNGTIITTPGEAGVITAQGNIELNGSGVTNEIRSITLTSNAENVFLKNVASGGTLTITASTGAADKDIEITETGAIAIASGGLRSGSAGHVYLSAGAAITQTGIIETPALQVKGGASGAITLNGDNKVATLAAVTTGANCSFTNADPLTVGNVTTRPGGTVNGLSAGAGVITLRADAMTFTQQVASNHVVIQNKTGGKNISLVGTGIVGAANLDLNNDTIGEISTTILDLGNRTNTNSITMASSAVLPSLNTLILRCSSALDTASYPTVSVPNLGVECGGNATIGLNVANLAVDSGGDVAITSTRTAGFTITSLGSPAITGLKGNNIGIAAAGMVSQQTTAPVTTAGTLTLGGTGAVYNLTASTANHIGTLVTSAPSPVSVIYTDNGSFSAGSISPAAGLTTTTGEVTLAAAGTNVITINNDITTAGGNVILKNPVVLGADVTVSTGAGPDGQIECQNTINGTGSYIQ
jgi:hypothetical protein